MIRKTYHPEKNLPAEYTQANSKLQSLKSAGVKLLGFDYDLTLFDGKDPRYSHEQVVELGFIIQQSNIYYLIMSSRSATLHRLFRDITAKIFQSNNNILPLTCYLSGGNGMNLSEVTFDRQGATTKTIYENVMTEDVILKVLEVYFGLNIKNPDQKAKTVFHNFLYKTNWQDLVPQKLLEMSKRYNDTVFVEGGKVSLILPAQQAERNVYLQQLRELLQPQGLNVVCNEEPFVHVSMQMPMDGKLMAARTVMERLEITDEQAGFFGDSPNGNDKGILSLLYSFTNCKRLSKQSLESPPYILKTTDSPVGAVHEAIHVLLK